MPIRAVMLIISPQDLPAGFGIAAANPAHAQANLTRDNRVWR